MLVFRAVPPSDREAPVLKDIAAELRELAQRLAGLPSGTGGTRAPDSAKTILQSLQNVNATLRKAEHDRSLSRDGFSTIAEDFEKISVALRGLGPDATKSSR